MTYALDTHALLWCLFEPKSLSANVRKVVEDGQTDVGVSPVCFWEVSLKYSLGKLELKGCEPEDIRIAAADAGLRTLELETDVLASYHRLVKTKHRDPFDRLIIWQCIQGGFTLLSKDPQMKLYARAGLRHSW